MVEIVEERGVGGEQVPWAVGKIIAAVVHDDFDGPHGGEQRGFVRVEAGQCEADGEPEHVDDDGLDGMVVKGAVGV